MPVKTRFEPFDHAMTPFACGSIVLALLLLALGVWAWRTARGKASPERKWRRLLGVGLALPALAAGTAGVAWLCIAYQSQPGPEKKQLFRGVAYERDVRRNPRPLVINVLTVDLRDPGVRLLVTPPESDGSLRARKTTQFLEAFDCQAAINGSFFEPCWYKGPWDYYPHPGDAVETHGRCMAGGIAYGKPWNDMIMYWGPGNRVTFRKPGPGARDALAGGWLCLRHGVPWTSDSTLLTSQTGVALDEKGDRLICVVIEGLRPGYSEGATVEELAAVMRDHGGYDGLHLDGGDSSTMAVRESDGRGRLLSGTEVPFLERAVANQLGIRAEPAAR